MRDIVHNIGATAVIPPAVLNANTTGAGIDLLGFDSVAFVIQSGAIAAAGAFTPKVQESDTDVDGNYADVPARLLQGELPATLAANSIAKVGYRGFKRFVRVVLTKTGGTSIAAGVVAVRAHASERPVA